MNRLQRTAARVFGIETRDSSYTDALVSAIQQHASGESTAFVSATAALEACSGLIARAFASASVTSTAAVEGVISAGFLEMLGRALIRKGELLVYITTTRNGELLLLPAESYDVDGDPDPASWKYRLTLGGPARSHTLDSVSASSVLHFKYGVDSTAPWRGLGPLQVAKLGGRLSANLAASLADEANASTGFLLPIPVEGDADTLAQLRAELGKLKGRAALVQAGDWGNPGGSNATDWSTRRLGPNPPLALVELHRLATEEVAISCGINPGLLSGRQQSIGREAYRQMLFATVAPLGKLVRAELELKLEVDVVLDWTELRAADISSRARAFQSLVGSGLELDRAAALSGLLLPEEKIATSS